jgi:hypothetical protein
MVPPIHLVEPFIPFFKPDGRLEFAKLDLSVEDSCTRREILLRYLLLSAAAGEGRNGDGARELLVDVTNQLYHEKNRFLLSPRALLPKLEQITDQIRLKHNCIEQLPAGLWKMEHLSWPSKYRAFVQDAKKTLRRAFFRWATPLAHLEVDAANGHSSTDVLRSYVERRESAETMVQWLKYDPRYGLGNGIDDRAYHLFAKWVVSTFSLAQGRFHRWSAFSYDLPYDADGGRVLWRTGFLLRWASEQDYRRARVIQEGDGRLNQLRIANMQRMVTSAPLPTCVSASYQLIVLHHMMTHKYPPRKARIARIPHAYLYSTFPTTHLHVAHFDDGLVYIGTHYCFNHGEPRCPECPINDLCEGYQDRPHLIQEYRT